MRAVIQRVSSASVSIGGRTVGAVGTGFLILLGVTHGDGEREADYLAAKCAALRVFRDSEDKMNLSLKDVGGGAVPLYQRFIQKLREAGVPVETGEFGADMEVSLCNDGPVTILMDTDEMMRK